MIDCVLEQYGRKKNIPSTIELQNNTVYSTDDLFNSNDSLMKLIKYHWRDLEININNSCSGFF